MNKTVDLDDFIARIKELMEQKENEIKKIS